MKVRSRKVRRMKEEVEWREDERRSGMEGG
jgi:hypothetical protein